MRHDYTLFKRKGQKIWYFHYYDLDGTRKPVSSGKTLKWEAEEFATEFVKALHGKGGIETLADLFAPYFTANCPRQDTLILNGRPMGAEHQAAQRSLLKRYVFTHKIADKDKNKITRDDLINFIIDCKKTYGDSLTHSIMRPFKTAWKDCLFRGKVSVDIVSGLGNIRYKKKERSALTVDEESLLFYEGPSPFRDARERITYLLADKAALRESEILALPWEYVDFKKHVIRVNQAWKNFWKQKMGLPKWDKLRIVPMCEELEKELMAYFLSVQTNRPSDYVICWDDGTPVSPSSWKDWFERIKKTINKDKIRINPETTPHWLRHTCITRWEEAGLSERLIRLYAGHSKEQTTAGYKHPSEEFLVAKLREKIG